MFLATFTIFLLLQQPDRKAAASHAALDEDKAKHLCKLAAVLTKTPNVAAHKFSTLQSLAEAASNAATIAESAAGAATGTNLSTVFKAVELVARGCAGSSIAAIADLQAKALPAVTNGPKTAGHIAETLWLLFQASKKEKGAGTNKYCIGKPNAATTAATLQDLQCPPEFATEATPLETLDDTTIDKTGYKGLTPGTAKISSSTGSTSCGFLLSAGDDATKLWSKSNPSGLTLMAGLLSVSPKDGAGTEDYTIDAIGKPDSNSRFTNAATTAKKLYNAIIDLSTHEIPNCGRTADEVLEHAISSGKAEALLTKTLGEVEPYKTTKSADKAAKEMLQAAADGKATEQAQKIKDKIRAQQVIRITAIGAVQKDLKTQATDEESRNTILLNHLKNREQLDKLVSELASANAVAQKTAQVPKPDYCKGKKGADCKDGCKEITENNEKKCVVDTEEATKVEGGEKDSKNGTTNTTGSNSFLINKAPLLLAFLLLA
uniref:Variant surface glycoprotein 1125.319 n=1 Tax=Trypanosoma brucei TaxID=5691 RepID=M4SYD3_9TRYP|nr:variant surface glycoprotein 556 [Trypanosoma brucei]APD73137.1 variant surface glycoprotein 1125.319 [Trypanosoma brucei]